MARDLFGNRKITNDDMYTKKVITNADVNNTNIISIITPSFVFIHY